MTRRRQIEKLIIAVMVTASVAFLASAKQSKSDEILLKYKATIVEESKDYIVIKFDKRDIGLVTERGKSRETLSAQASVKENSLNLVPSEQSLSREELKKELLQELRGEIQKEVTKGIGPIEHGSVEGRIVRSGQGVPEVRVKLIRWVEESSFLGIFKELKKGAEFETTTDEEGRYTFKNIPVGNYQLKWLPRGSDGWIRRLTEKPDVRVVLGKMYMVPPVELSKPILK